jgi:hypothetical protein
MNMLAVICALVLLVQTFFKSCTTIDPFDMHHLMRFNNHAEQSQYLYTYMIFVLSLTAAGIGDKYLVISMWPDSVL